jgi:uncharacterized protein (DUF4213/DUF364 family)
MYCVDAADRDTLVKMIIEQTYNLIKKKYSEGHKNLVVADCRIGFYLTVVRLSDGSIGICSTLNSDNPICAKPHRDFGDLTPLKIKGQKVMDILESPKKSGIISTLKTAVLSALSSKIIASGNYHIIENCDPVQLLDIGPDKTVTIVGAFHSYISEIKQNCKKLYVLELDESTIPPNQKNLYVPADKFQSVIPVSDIVIITGQAIINQTIDDLLSAVSPGTQVAVTGPSGNILPDILFENKVTVLGTFRITNPELLFDLVSEGGRGYHLYRYCAEKICILKNNGTRTQ